MRPNPLLQMTALGAARVRAGAADAGLLIGIGLCVLVAAGLGLAAAWWMLRPMLGTAGAFASLAAGLLLFAQGLALWRVTRRKNRASPLAAALATPIADPVADGGPPPDLAASAAFLAGFLLARRLF